MAFSSKLKAHKRIFTLETLKFISEYVVDQNSRQAALRIGIPETYAARYGQWLKKQASVRRALETELDESDIRQLHKVIADIEQSMELCKDILGIKD